MRIKLWCEIILLINFIYYCQARQIDAEELPESLGYVDRFGQIYGEEDDADSFQTFDVYAEMETSDNLDPNFEYYDGHYFGDRHESNAMLLQRFNNAFNPSNLTDRWIKYVEPRLILPKTPSPPSHINMMKPIQLPELTIDEMKTGFKIYAFEDAQRRRIPADDVIQHWLTKRGQCSLSVHLSLPSLAKLPCAVPRQDELFDAMFQCGWHDTLQQIGHFILEKCMNVTYRIVKTAKNDNELLKAFVDPRKEFKDRKPLKKAIINAHWWLATSKFFTGKNLNDAWDHMGIVRMLETTGLRLQGGAYMHETWPQYCVEWRRLEPALIDISKGIRSFDERANLDYPYDVKLLRMFGREIDGLFNTIVERKAKKSDPKITERRENLLKLLMEMRKLECSDDFIYMEMHDRMPKDKDSLKLKEVKQMKPTNDILKPFLPNMNILPAKQYGFMNFQYGTFFLYGFAALVADDRLTRYFSALKNNDQGYKFFHLGGNIGNEAFYGALAFDLPTIGIEIRPKLVEISKSFQEKYAKNVDLTFLCQDALKADVSKAGVVYLDSEIWDAELRLLIQNKVLKEMPPNSLIITPHPFVKPRADWNYLGKNNIAGTRGTTWETTIFYLYAKEGLDE